MVALSNKEKFDFSPHQSHFKRVNSRYRTYLLIAGVFSLWLIGFLKLLPDRAPSSKSPYAYATLLVSSPDFDNKTVSDEQDDYYIATRVMAYQLLHSPDTGTNTSIPFIVIASKEIQPHKVKQLEKDGCIVMVVDNIQPSWMKPGLKKWRHTMNKLYLFALTQYQKVLFIDADSVIVKRLDSIFTDPTTEPLVTNHTLATHDDEGPMPDSYTMAAQAAFESPDHEYPPSKEYSATGHLSSGFFLTSPSMPLFNHYMQVANIEGRFRDNAMEQDLLNYVHRRGGPMPWADITYTWTSTWPSDKELKKGAATLHTKFWVDSEKIDLSIRKIWLIAKGEMQGYWRGREMAGW